LYLARQDIDLTELSWIPLEPYRSAVHLVVAASDNGVNPIPSGLGGVAVLELLIGAILVAIIAGALGFTGLARGAATLAKMIFGIFAVIALILIIAVVAGIDLLT